MGESMVKTESMQVDVIMKYEDINGLQKIMQILHVCMTHNRLTLQIF